MGGDTVVGYCVTHSHSVCTHRRARPRLWVWVGFVGKTMIGKTMTHRILLEIGTRVRRGTKYDRE